jgi:hypothetical protein
LSLPGRWLRRPCGHCSPTASDCGPSIQKFKQ